MLKFIDIKSIRKAEEASFRRNAASFPLQRASTIAKNHNQQEHQNPAPETSKSCLARLGKDSQCIRYRVRRDISLLSLLMLSLLASTCYSRTEILQTVRHQ